MAIAASHPDDARRYGTQAIDGFETVAASVDAARVATALKTAGVRLARRRTTESGWDRVTRSEQRVIALVAEGLTNGEIAARLFVSRRTVESHLHHVYAKVGLGSRTELALAVVERSDP